MTTSSRLLNTLVLCVLFFTIYFVAYADTTSTLRPVADGGDDNWKNSSNTSCSGVDCYTEVDESSGASCTNSDGDTSYVKSDANGATQTFNLDASGITDDSTVTNIAITACYSEGDTTLGSFQTRWCHNGTCSDSGVSLVGGATYSEATQNHSVNFTKTSGSDIEIGVTQTRGGKNIYISQLSAVVTYTPPVVIPPNGGGGGADSSGGGQATRVVFRGQAYPLGTIEVLRKGRLDDVYPNTPEEVIIMNEDGTFSNSYTGLLGTDYIFSVIARDVDGRDSGTLSFTTDLLFTEFFEMLDLFFPPTVEFQPFAVTKGKDVHIIGYAAGNNTIELEIDGDIVEETQSNDSGYYEFVLSTESLELGKYTARVRQIDYSSDLEEPKTSGFSTIKTFRVTLLTYPQFDFNVDDSVDTTDWSIFLFRWSSEDSSIHSTLDVNNDGAVNIEDFSIFLKSITI